MALFEDFPVDQGKDSVVVIVEWDQKKVTFTGRSDEVVASLLKFLTQEMPGLELFRSIIATQDLKETIQAVSGLMIVDEDGISAVHSLQASVPDLCLLALAGQRVGHKLGKLASDSLSPGEIARLFGESEKTVRNRLGEMASRNLVRLADGQYALTAGGLRNFLDSVAPKLKSQLSAS